LISGNCIVSFVKALLPPLIGLWALVSPAVADAGCWVSTSGIAFGAYDVIFDRPRDSTAVIRLGCHDEGPQEVRLGLGPSAVSGTVFSRRLARVGGGGSLEYNLFMDPARSLVWGEDASGGPALRVVVPGRDAPQQVLVYGRVFGGQEPRPGQYTDSVAISILP
jgi:spore coat protein U-like protein